jgi:tRNA threonylcarbamoyl adenosine modification protein YeaZ/ribosomal-protein-alanine acetyltransferase
MLLAIDTCFHACSAALYDQDAVQASRYVEMERGHAEALGPMVAEVFAEAGVTPKQLSTIAVTIGPGTFTGLRIGLAYAKGLGVALGIPVVGLNSLLAIAASHQGQVQSITVVQKAGGTGLFYEARYDGMTLAEQSPPQIASAAVANSVSGNPNAKLFAPFASSLDPKTHPANPMYLRPPDAKPSVVNANANTRLATADDMAALADIHQQSFFPGWDEASLRSSLSLPGAGALVVELAGVIYGFVQFQTVASEAEINTICVSPNYRRQHFGRDLMQGLVEFLQKAGVHKLFLDVAADNHAAIGLYGQFGFQQNGLRKAYYASGKDAVLMVRELVV